MFIPPSPNQSRKPAAKKRAPADPARGGAGPAKHDAAPALNPVWQSLAIRPFALQPKLSVSQPGDVYEREADRVAEQVMRMPEPEVATTAAPAQVQRMCAECEEETESRGVVQRKCHACEEEVQAKEEPYHTPSVPGGFAQRFAALHGYCQPLPAAERPLFEPRFGGGSGVALQRKPLTDEERDVDLESDPFRDSPQLQDAFDNNPPMGVGESGDAVRRVQQALVDLGFQMPVTTKKGTQEPDGIYGPETARTVKSFQHMQGITKDGIVGRETLGELEGRITGAHPPGTPAPFTVPSGAPSVKAVDRSPQRFEACDGGGGGRFHWEVAWETNARNGYIVQQMESAQEGEFCDGTPSDLAPVAPLFWEAWRVQQDGKVHPPPGTDTWQVPIYPFHWGTWQLTGKVFFVEQLDPQAGFRTGNEEAPQASTLYATAVRPRNLGPVLLTRRAAGRWECCGDTNVHEPVELPAETPTEADEGQAQPDTQKSSEVEKLSERLLTDEGQATSDVQSERPSQDEAFVETQAVPSPVETCPPGYTQCDFIDEHISVPGQFALYELYKRGGEECANALAMLSAAHFETIQGVYKASEEKPARMALRHDTAWWELVPPGQGAVVFQEESPPMAVFRENLASDRKALATALNDAWKASGEVSPDTVPPSLKPCPLIPPPPPQPEPQPEPQRECPPGTTPHPTEDICVLPGQSVPKCTDAQMHADFQWHEDQCANILSGLDMVCQMGPSVCDFGKNPAKVFCDAYERIFGKPLPKTKPPECFIPRAEFYERCIVGGMLGMRRDMSCYPGSAAEILEKYRRWPGREK